MDDRVARIKFCSHRPLSADRHAVQGAGGNFCFGGLGLQFATAQVRSDDLLVAPDPGLAARTLAMTGGLLLGHPATASALNQIVTSPRWQSAPLYSARFVTRYFVFANLSRPAVLYR